MLRVSAVRSYLLDQAIPTDSLSGWRHPLASRALKGSGLDGDPGYLRGPEGRRAFLARAGVGGLAVLLDAKWPGASGTPAGQRAMVEYVLEQMKALSVRSPFERYVVDGRPDWSTEGVLARLDAGEDVAITFQRFALEPNRQTPTRVQCRNTAGADFLTKERLRNPWMEDADQGDRTWRSDRYRSTVVNRPDAFLAWFPRSYSPILGR